MAHRCRGRVLAARDRMDEAEAAFEAAVAAAASCELWLLEAMAVRDLTRHVLEPAGRAQDGRKRLAQIVEKMASSEAELERCFENTE